MSGETITNGAEDLSDAPSERDAIDMTPIEQLEKLTQHLEEMVGGLTGLKNHHNDLYPKINILREALAYLQDALSPTREDLREKAQEIASFRGELNSAIISTKFGIESLGDITQKIIKILKAEEERIQKSAQSKAKENDSSTAEKDRTIDLLRAQLAAALKQAAEAERERDAAKKKLERKEERLRKVEEENRNLQLEIKLDPLTGVNSQQTWMKNREALFNHFVRNQRTFCLAVIDIDYFKKINDTYGHAQGDMILKELGELLNETLRPKDRIYRIKGHKEEEREGEESEDVIFRAGGEEFTVFLPDCNEEDALKALNRLQKRLEQKYFILTKLETKKNIFARVDSNDFIGWGLTRSPFINKENSPFQNTKIPSWVTNGEEEPESETLKITVSIGVAKQCPKTKNVKELFELADRALYAAKDNGRNRIEIGQIEIGQIEG
jgi:GGDEF domain-containing protein